MNWELSKLVKIFSLEIESEQKRLKYYRYIDYLRSYYFSDHAWTNVGNNFAIFASNGIRNFTNNTSEGINRAFKEEFKSAPNTLENVLLRVKELKKIIFCKSPIKWAKTECGQDRKIRSDVLNVGKT